MINSNSINELANKLLEILSTSVNTPYLLKGEKPTPLGVGWIA